ncbi:chemotaxis protein CheC [Sulfurimonas sp. MAG313]|nr:chemotaxis protein CheC [Sulfurimonas sp. MAG313]MDF1880710.1 chemotaxis protein CheC [Sulfurimonas sp. MAG313]
MNKKYSLSEDQLEVLQELMNIAYGSATAIIADILDAFATLDIPRIEVISTSEFELYLKNMLKQEGDYFFCSQGINGDLCGESIFLLSRESITKLSKYFDFDDNVSDTDLKDVALELTNILSSSTVGKLAQEMGTTVSFSAPTTDIIDGFSLQDHENIRQYSQVIIIQTLISFQNEKIEGELIILTKDQSILWMKDVLDTIIKDLFS